LALVFRKMNVRPTQGMEAARQGDLLLISGYIRRDDTAAASRAGWSVMPALVAGLHVLALIAIK
jgi:hypothetical protein